MSATGDRIGTALEAGEELRRRVDAYRAAWSASARSLASARREGEDVSDAFASLRSDWARTAAAFREAADRIGTALKTLGREC